jgi:hypothetical protein
MSKEWERARGNICVYACETKMFHVFNIQSMSVLKKIQLKKVIIEQATLEF